MAAGAKVPIVDAFKMTGAPPATALRSRHDRAGDRHAGHYVSQSTSVDGRVDITFGNDHARTRTSSAVRLSFTPYSPHDSGSHCQLAVRLCRRTFRQRLAERWWCHFGSSAADD